MYFLDTDKEDALWEESTVFSGFKTFNREDTITWEVHKTARDISAETKQILERYGIATEITEVKKTRVSQQSSLDGVGLTTNLLTNLSHDYSSSQNKQITVLKDSIYSFLEGGLPERTENGLVTGELDLFGYRDGVNIDFALRHPSLTNALEWATQPIDDFFNDNVAGQTINRFSQSVAESVGALPASQIKSSTGYASIDRAADGAGLVAGYLPLLVERTR